MEMREMASALRQMSRHPAATEEEREVFGRAAELLQVIVNKQEMQQQRGKVIRLERRED